VRSENLEQMSVGQLVELFVDEEKFVGEALHGARADLAGAIKMIANSLRKGGRLFYVGAGTSGRLGVLDASEIPPTFGAPSELVQGIIAGGVTALFRSVEGAEDEHSNGALAIGERGVKDSDVVLGITASGRTPFVLGALAHAKSLGAKALLLSCNPARGVVAGVSPADSEIAAGTAASTPIVDLRIDLATGPEILAGSTRLKAGTATKVALNIISTGVMVALGKVRGNRMIDLAASSNKLRDRAARLVAEQLQCDYADAVERLQNHDWNLRAAINSAK
jgi:N-acetylmuramic acid 6-phosphate etherase